MEKSKGARVCLFGGTFDPVHLGHLIIAQAVLESAGLDRMIFVPSARPPHKGDEVMFDARTRFEFLTRAVRGNPAFSVSDVEMRRTGLSYTIDTIRQIKAELPPGDELFFLVGRDNLSELETWREPRAILDECTVLAADRVCTRPRPVPDWVAARVRTVTVPLIEISSTEIRARIRAGHSIRYLVPEVVGEMILEARTDPR